MAKYYAKICFSSCIVLTPLMDSCIYVICIVVVAMLVPGFESDKVGEVIFFIGSNSVGGTWKR